MRQSVFGASRIYHVEHQLRLNQHAAMAPSGRPISETQSGTINSHPPTELTSAVPPHGSNEPTWRQTNFAAQGRAPPSPDHPLQYHEPRPRHLLPPAKRWQHHFFPCPSWVLHQREFMSSLAIRPMTRSRQKPCPILFKAGYWILEVQLSEENLMNSPFPVETGLLSTLQDVSPMKFSTK